MGKTSREHKMLKFRDRIPVALEFCSAGGQRAQFQPKSMEEGRGLEV